MILRDKITILVYSTVVALLLLVQGYLIGTSITAKRIAQEDRKFLECLVILSKNNRTLINEVREKNGFLKDEIDDEIALLEQYVQIKLDNTNNLPPKK